MPHIYKIDVAEAHTIMNAAGHHDITEWRTLISRSMIPSVNNPVRFAMRMTDIQVVEEFGVLKGLARETIRGAAVQQRDISAASHYDMPAIRPDDAGYGSRAINS